MFAIWLFSDLENYSLRLRHGKFNCKLQNNLINKLLITIKASYRASSKVFLPSFYIEVQVRGKFSNEYFADE